MGEVVPFRRPLTCILCGSRYIDIPGPAIRHAGLERRADICPDCRGVADTANTQTALSPTA